MSDEQPPADQPSTPRVDAAPPAWYPHPRQPGALRYWNGVAWVEADATQGWYPDPADRRDLRFWTGRTWGEVLGDDPSAPAIVPTPVAEPEPAPIPEPTSEPVAFPTDPTPEPAWDPERAASVDAVLGASAPPPIAAVAPNPRLAKAPGEASSSWITAVASIACLVAGVVIGGVVVSTFLGGDEPSATKTVIATASPTGTGAPAVGDDTALTIVKVLSSRTLELKGEEGKVEVRLLGLGDTTCDTNGPGKDLLKEQVTDQDAVISTLTDPVTGDIGAYVDVAGQDVGELLIRAGLATAAVGHPRAPAYAKAQAAAEPFCASGAPSGTPSGSPTASATS